MNSAVSVSLILRQKTVVSADCISFDFHTNCVCLEVPRQTDEVKKDNRRDDVLSGRSGSESGAWIFPYFDVTHPMTDANLHTLTFCFIHSTSGHHSLHCCFIQRVVHELIAMLRRVTVSRDIMDIVGTPGIRLHLT